MEGLYLKKGMTEEELEKEIFRIFFWLADNKYPSIGKNYEFGKDRIHLFTYMKPVILSKIFNIIPVPVMDNNNLVFLPGTVYSIFMDDRIDDIWIDDIMPIHDICNLFKRWHINSLIAHYLDQDIIKEFSEEEKDEFFICLKKKLNKKMPINLEMIDHNSTSKEISDRLKDLFDTIDKYLYFAFSEKYEE